jgi:hypothetical protein
MKEVISYIAENKEISVRSQCKHAGVNRSNVYYKHVGESEENLQFMPEIIVHG